MGEALRTKDEEMGSAAVEFAYNTAAYQEDGFAGGQYASARDAFSAKAEQTGLYAFTTKQMQAMNDSTLLQNSLNLLTDDAGFFRSLYQNR